MSMDPLHPHANGLGGESPPKKSQMMRIPEQSIEDRIRKLVQTRDDLTNIHKQHKKELKAVEKEMYKLTKESITWLDKAHNGTSNPKEKIAEFQNVVMAKVKAKVQEQTQLKKQIKIDKNEIEVLTQQIDDLKG